MPGDQEVPDDAEQFAIVEQFAVVGAGVHELAHQIVVVDRSTPTFGDPCGEVVGGTDTGAGGGMTELIDHDAGVADPVGRVIGPPTQIGVVGLGHAQQLGDDAQRE